MGLVCATKPIDPVACYSLSVCLTVLALRLHADGRLETAVSRVVGIHFDVDYSIKGY